MLITAVSDLHGKFPTLSGGDLLILAGDFTAADKVQQWMEFFEWVKAQNYRQKVIIGGNHDGFLERCISSQEAREMLIDAQEGFEYLCDTGIEFEGLKIWGSPWTPRFCNWHFMLTRGERLKEKWALIPDDTDILVTHGPTFGMLDKNKEGRRCGCLDLGIRVDDLKQLKLHVFGHIHEGYGTCYASEYTPGCAMEVLLPGYDKSIFRGPLSINAAYMDENYNPTNKPINVIWDGVLMKPEIKDER